MELGHRAHLDLRLDALNLGKLQPSRKLRLFMERPFCRVGGGVR